MGKLMPLSSLREVITVRIARLVTGYLPHFSLRAELVLLSLLFIIFQSLLFVYFISMSSAAPIQLHEKPEITFGVIADVQYADCDDGTDYSKTRQRFYRNALNLLKNAANDWKRSTNPLSFILQLGDLIDGKNKNEEGSSVKSLSTVLKPLESLHIPVCHVIGNHELYNMNRSFYLSSPLNTARFLEIDSSSESFYYTLLPHPKLRIIALDTYEISLLGYNDNPENENFKTAQKWFQQNNPNKDVHDLTGLVGLDKRWAAYNGGIGDKQLTWLSQVLVKAEAQEENVIIMSHIALQCEDRDYAICLAWNYQEIMRVIHQHQCVIAVFAGHEHAGWDFLDSHGIQHITFQAIVETRPGSNAYATAQLWKKELNVTGVGRVPSFTIPLKYHL